MLAVDTMLVDFNTTPVCNSIENLSQSSFGLSRVFLGLVLLPVIDCNSHAIKLACRDQTLRSFTISISGSAQLLLLLVLPRTVLEGWMLGDPKMTLSRWIRNRIHFFRHHKPEIFNGGW